MEKKGGSSRNSQKLISGVHSQIVWHHEKWNEMKKRQNCWVAPVGSSRGSTFLFFSPYALHNSVCMYVSLSLVLYRRSTSGVGMSCNHEINTKRCMYDKCYNRTRDFFGRGGGGSQGVWPSWKDTTTQKMSPRRIPAVTAFFLLLQSDDAHFISLFLISFNCRVIGPDGSKLKFHVMLHYVFFLFLFLWLEIHNIEEVVEYTE